MNSLRERNTFNTVTAIGAASGLALAAYFGASGSKNVEFTPEQKQAAYEQFVQPLTASERFAAEFITGISLCNPNDRSSYFEFSGISPSSPGPRGSCNFLDNETDEQAGRECLAGTPYDITPARFNYMTNQQVPAGTGILEVVSESPLEITIYPAGSGQPELNLLLNDNGIEAVNQRTQNLLENSYDCGSIPVRLQK